MATITRKQPLEKFYVLICCVNGKFYYYTGTKGIFSDRMEYAKVYSNVKNMKNAVQCGRDWKNTKIWKTNLGGIDVKLFKALVIAHVLPEPNEIEELLTKY